ncbi:YncE family protein [Pseudoclavibacter sp. CFCC 11306]|uniref:YncE family protein n=1 Tax=Pseudoclavibacter sp. CFCC 11306 TaxID=1564493 RepID=UPI0013018720|nr:YncE family protein [Pseudoclavibacter sp. CFCC 11306]KAB1657143.1 YncE family protein [Pseudoclavibacter sp. CFCC 11306]
MSKNTTQNRTVRRSAAITGAGALLALTLTAGGGLIANAAPVSGASFGPAAAAAEVAATPQITLDKTSVGLDGATIHVTGTGVAPDPEGNPRQWFAVKLLTGGTGVVLPNQEAGTWDASGFLKISDAKYLPDANGNFAFDLVVPSLKAGSYTVQILGGNGGGSSMNPKATFTAEPQATEATMYLDEVLVADNKVSVWVFGKKLPKDSKLTAQLDGKKVPGTWMLNSKPTDVIGPDNDAGDFNHRVLLDAGAALAGSEHVLTITNSLDNSTYDIPFTAVPSTVDSSFNTPSQGAQGDITFGNLPQGAKVTGIGPDGANWLGTDQTAVAGADNRAKISFTIPADAPVGQDIRVAYRVGEKNLSVDLGQKVTPNNAEINADKFTVTHATGPQGLYQLVDDKKTGSLFATFTQWGKQTGVAKIDPKTLAVLQTGPAAKTAEGADIQVFGIGIDNSARKVVASATSGNGIVVYDADDLTKAPVYVQGGPELNHARDVAVDETSHKAYVGSSLSNTIGVFDLNENKYVDTIALGTEEEPFTGVMSFDFDEATGDLYTTSLSGGRAAKVETRNGNKATYYQLGELSSASGTAFDPVKKQLFIAAQGNSDVTVVDTVSGKVVKSIPTGGGALNLFFDPVHRFVYSANRTGGTVSVIDADSLERVGNLDAGQYPNDVTVTPDGVAYAVNKADENNQIFRIDPTGFPVKKDDDKEHDNGAGTGDNDTKPDAKTPANDTNHADLNQSGNAGDNSNAAQANGSEGKLARTGLDEGLLIAGGAAVIAAGAILVAQRRLRRHG